MTHWSSGAVKGSQLLFAKNGVMTEEELGKLESGELKIKRYVVARESHTEEPYHANCCEYMHTFRRRKSGCDTESQRVLF